MILLDFEQPLQTCLVVGEAEIPIDTSFRAWLRFSRILDETGLCDPSVLLSEPPAGADWRPEAIRFLTERPSTPHDAAPSRDRGYDVQEDADYIVGSFQAVYGIDLTDPALDMHWHRFMALLRSLPQGSKLAEIIGYRTWNRAAAKRSPESAAAEMKRIWSLPATTAEQREEIVSLQKEWFGNVLPGGGKDG